MKCQDCELEKEDVRIRLCPYQQDVNDREVEVTICDDCCHERAMDI